MPRLSEFDLIAKLFAPLATSPGAFGLKDDAAVIAPRAGFDLVITTDTIVEGVDFFANDPPDSIAKKALRINLSDLAAKGAEPYAYLLTLSLPRGIEEPWLASFARGLGEDQKHYAVDLLGGDISLTPGPVSISVTAFGHVPEGRIIRRNGARIGDAVFVTGTIGDSGGGLALLKGEVQSDFRDQLVARYRIPEPPVRFGPKLRELASASLDVSDGLLADLGHIADASGMRIVIEAANIPRSQALRALWGDGVDVIARAAISGDDYQIAFTAPPSHVSDILGAAREADIAVAQIGRVERGTGLLLLDEKGSEIAVVQSGFRHF